MGKDEMKFALVINKATCCTNWWHCLHYLHTVMLASLHASAVERERGGSKIFRVIEQFINVKFVLDKLAVLCPIACPNV
jgi:hypothetical protein